MAQGNRNRLKIIGVVGLLGLIVLGFLVWWFLFRDTSAASVDSVEAAEAREAAIAEAVGDPSETPDDEPADDGITTVEGSASESSNAETDQADAAAAVANATDGLWAVDTSIGTFDDACLSEVCGAGFVGFRINEELASIGAKTVVGRTPGVSGTMQISGTQITSAEITADMTQILTDDPTRTGALRGRNGGLETDTFPEATFVLAEPIELGEIPVEGAAVSVEAVGDLTVHGVTNRVTIPLTAELQAGVIIVVGSLVDIELADYDIPKPTSIVVLSVEEIATMELQLFFRR